MPIQLTADAAAPGGSLVHYWSACIGAGRANEGIRADWQAHLRLAIAECGFKYVRFHGLFHDDMFVYRINDAGEEVFNFQYVDALFDSLLAAGIKPFVEFGFCPHDMARETDTVFWWKGNGSPPKDYQKWAALIRRTVNNWIERYGIDEVRTWYFEVWNEPNLHPFFKGTKQEYFQLYKTTVQTVKSIDSALRVGGPSTSNFVPDDRFAGETEDTAQHGTVVNAADPDALDWRPVWVADFLAFCSREALPVDFISCHPYPTDWALDAQGQTVKSTRGVDATRSDLTLLRSLILNSEYPAAEIHLTEWSSSPSPRDHTHDHLQAATYIVKANVESIGLVDSLSYWVFTDVFEEGGAGDTAFHGGFGMITLQGVPKPSFHAYRMLHALGDEVLSRGPGGIVTRHRGSGKIAALVYHYPPEVGQAVPASFDTRKVAERTLERGAAETVSLKITGCTPHTRVAIETLDRGHGNAIAAWHAMGAPASPTALQTELLKKAANVHVTYAAADAEGKLVVERAIQPWSVLLVRQL